jgi:hypothetical protein
MLQMAKDKKSFILYVDQKDLFNKLPDDIAGKLIKHIYSYVNDEDPKAEELIIEIAFEPIKQQLKRDLKLFEDVKVKRSEAGKVGASKRWNEMPNDANQCEPIANDGKRIKSMAKIAVNVNDNVNDINSNIKDRKQKFASSLVPFVELYGKELVRQFYEYWTEHGPKDKKMRFEKQTSFNLELRIKRWNQKQVDAKKPIYKQPAPIWE